MEKSIAQSLLDKREQEAAANAAVQLAATKELMAEDQVGYIIIRHEYLIRHTGGSYIRLDLHGGHYI